MHLGISHGSPISPSGIREDNMEQGEETRQKTEDEARQWIDQSSTSWLSTRLEDPILWLSKAAGSATAI